MPFSSSLGFGESTSAGESVVFTTSTLAAGTYYLGITTGNRVTPIGTGATMPSYFTQPYTVVVTQ